MLKEQRDSLFNDNGDYFDEGANLDIRHFYKDAQKRFKMLITSAKNAANQNDYDTAITQAKRARKVLDSCYDNIQHIDAGSAGSQICAWVLGAGFLPLLGRTILMSLLPYAGIVVGIDLVIKRIKVIISDTKDRNLKSDDFNAYKNAIKVKLKEYQKSC